MNSKQAGRSRDPAAAANAIMHADVRVFSLLPRDLKRNALREPTDYTPRPRENHVLLADHKVCTSQLRGYKKKIDDS